MGDAAAFHHGPEETIPKWVGVKPKTSNIVGCPDVYHSQNHLQGTSITLWRILMLKTLKVISPSVGLTTQASQTTDRQGFSSFKPSQVSFPGLSMSTAEGQVYATCHPQVKEWKRLALFCFRVSGHCELA